MIQDKELEQTVLGIIILSGESFKKVAEFIIPEMFHQEGNKLIANSIIKLYAEGQPIEVISIVQSLKKQGKLEKAGGAFYISQLTNTVGSIGGLEFHCRILHQIYLKRSAVEAATSLLLKAQEDATDIFELIDTYEKQLSDITRKVVGSKFSESHELYAKNAKRMQTIRENGGRISGVSSGFYDLDKVTGGWQNSDLIILAARPAMGKTSIALDFLKNPAIKNQVPTAIFSLEMSNEQLYSRLQAQVSEIPLEKLLRKGITEKEEADLLEKCTPLINAPIYFEDTGAITVFELKNKARKVVREKGVQLIIVDYLQLVRGGEKGGNRETEISFISRSLKALAKELNIPVIALSQLSRAVETRAGCVPMLSDLRESGSIEQDADMVMFIYRPEYYGITEDESGNSTAGKAIIMIEKHRNGSLAKPMLRFEGQYTRFSNLANEEHFPELTNDVFKNSRNDEAPW